MNDRLPYEEQLADQLNDLPLPDENIAWEDMKRRLEDDDDGGIIPVWLRGCGLWGLLAIVLIGIGWWLIRPEKWWNKKQETESSTTINQKENNPAGKSNTDDTTHFIPKPTIEKPAVNKPDGVKNSVPDSSLINSTAGKKRPLLKENNDLPVTTENSRLKKNKTTTGKEIVKKSSPVSKKVLDKKSKIQTDRDQVDISIQPAAGNKKDTDNDVIKTNPTVPFKDSTPVITTSVNKTDSIAKATSPDSTQKNKDEETVKTNEPKKDSSKPKTISFSAGVAMHQLLPVDGQKLTPYSSQGRKSSLADYIPSVFARMYRDDKWFVQLEFRYGAPQYTKNVLYDQQSVLDTAGGVNNTIITSHNLKKTFYHQLPFSFNYFVGRNWSIGGGFVWNKFYSAVAERGINKRNNLTQADSIISKTILATKQDTSSVFTKSYFQLLFETQYRWRRFSIGARYSFGLQPYIRFNLNGVNREERNKSLQIFLRYELWKSKPKK